MIARGIDRRWWLALSGCAIALGSPAGFARAASCGRPDLLAAIPPDGATDVPPNASFFAHYDISAEYAGEDVVFARPGGSDEVVTATFDATEGMLKFTPPEPLPPGVGYTIRWPVLRGLNAAAPGRAANVTFSVGPTNDEAPPDFDGLTGVVWDLHRTYSDCAKAQEERVVFDLALAPAADDGGRDGLTLLIFQTAGAGVGDNSVPVSTMAMPAAGKSVAASVTVHDAVGHTCLAALARDLTGKISNGGSHEVCVDVTAPPFFAGCDVIPRGTPAARAGDLFVAVLTLAIVSAIAIARARARAGARGSVVDAAGTGA